MRVAVRLKSSLEMCFFSGICTRKKLVLPMKMIIILLSFVLVFDNAEASEDRRQYTFAWPYAESGAMSPRGGMSVGPDVKLVKSPGMLWNGLREEGLTDFERDRRAILAMQGPYRASFDFLEVAGFSESFKPDVPYQSWGTEYVYVIADEGDFISLQHIMVLFFKKGDGSSTEPIVVKHWRQDWSYQDRNLYTYAGFNTWQPRSLSRSEAKGTWTQAVFQVDDSPRYEAFGAWEHKANYSKWQSNETWRPLPRREFSHRDDYQVLVGTNRHTITPTGWTHQEDNIKVVLNELGQVAGDGVLAQELGFNRYERLEGFDFSAGDEYWARSQEFWREVRLAWKERLEKRVAVTLAEEIEGERLFSRMFGYAGKIGNDEPYDELDARRYISETLAKFVIPQ